MKLEIGGLEVVFVARGFYKEAASFKLHIQDQQPLRVNFNGHLLLAGCESIQKK